MTCLPPPPPLAPHGHQISKIQFHEITFAGRNSMSQLLFFFFDSKSHQHCFKYSACSEFSFHFFASESSYQIGVRNTDGDSTSTGKISKRSVPEFQHYDKTPSTYIAAEFVKLPEKFVVGDNKMYGDYRNSPLEEGAVYKIYVGAVSSNGTVSQSRISFCQRKYSLLCR